MPFRRGERRGVGVRRRGAQVRGPRWLAWTNTTVESKRHRGGRSAKRLWTDECWDWLAALTIVTTVLQLVGR